jgi:hypothetical protein
MSGPTITTEANRLADIRIQSSAYGSCIPWLLVGRGRVAGNLVWYGNFKAIKHTDTSSAGGKGGGSTQESVTYTYEAAVIVGLSRGPLHATGAVWRGKEQLASLAAAGLSFANGALEQPGWTWLSGYAPDESSNYSGLAYAYAQSYSLDDSASLENHNFELDAGGLGTVPGVAEPVVDGDPRVAVELMLTDTRSGGQWPADRLKGLDRFQTYCRAAGLWLSPVLTERRTAIEWLKQILMLTNTRAAWTGTALEFVPLGDEDLTAHGATFTADTTPDFDLTLDDFAPESGEPPVRVRRHVGLTSEAQLASSDDVGYNVITLEIEDRAGGYASLPITRDDLTSIELYGRREKDKIKAPEVKDPAIGAQIAQQLLQDEQVKRNRYEFRLTWRHCRLRPLRLVTLTEPSRGLDRTPVRVLEVEELDDLHIAVVAEDAPIGSASAPRYGHQAGQGYQQNYAVAPGTVDDAAIFEAPAALAAGTTGLEVWCAVRSPGATWGGCTVWVSLDGDTYRALGRVTGDARMGQLSAPITAGLLSVYGMSGQLVGGSAVDAEQLATLSVVLGAQPEYLAYEGATLTGAGAYTLGGLVRGAYGTPAPTHSTGDRFVRCDGALVKSGGLDVSYIGKRIWFKFTSFNVYLTAEESLSDVDPVPYDVTGYFAQAAPGTAGRGLTLKASAVAAKQDGSGVRTPDVITLTAEVKGSLQGVPTWSVVEGAATLSGAGLQRTVASSTITAPARIRISLTDEVGTYTDEVTLTVVSDGSAGADGTKYAQAVLYQWSTVQPSAPNGQSTWTWATASQSAYTGGNAWQIGIPANPGSAGLKLWSATQQISAAGTVASTTVSWAAGAAVAAVGANGAGVQSAEASVYAWAANLASLPALVGTSVYTWSSSSLSAAPAGWSLQPGTAAAPGQTLYRASVRVSDATTQPTTAVDWTLSSVNAIGYAGTQGGAGASARLAYARVTGTTIGAGQIQTTGTASLPPANAWGRGETWQNSVPALSPTESIMISNGLYDPASDIVTWGSPYLASWRVGKLSAISADIGDITAGSVNINGKFVVSSDGYATIRGLQILDDATGNVILSTKSSASASLPASWVTPAGEWLNSNVSLQSLGQQTWSVVAVGASNTATPPAASGTHYNGQHLNGSTRSYNMSRISRATGQIAWGPQTYDVYGGGANTSGRNAATLATDLNATTSDFIVVVWTDDEPQNNRMSGGLPAAMYRCGASAAVFGSPAFRYRSAYILVGIPGCGAGNGAEAYQGAVDADTNAWCELAFTVVNGAISGVSVGHTPASLQDYGYIGDLNATNGATWNSNVTGQPADNTIKNDQIGINSSGQVYGIGAGNGVTVSNSQLSIGGDGRLYSAGSLLGGQVTLAGLGAGAMAAISQINAANVSTYIAAASLSLAQIDVASITSLYALNISAVQITAGQLVGDRIASDTIVARHIVSESVSIIRSTSFAASVGVGGAFTGNFEIDLVSHSYTTYGLTTRRHIVLAGFNGTMGWGLVSGSTPSSIAWYLRVQRYTSENSTRVTVYEQQLSGTNSPAHSGTWGLASSTTNIIDDAAVTPAGTPVVVYYVVTIRGQLSSSATGGAGINMAARTYAGDRFILTMEHQR